MYANKYNYWQEQITFFEQEFEQKLLFVVYGLLTFFEKNTNKLQEMYDLGVRHSSLTWNEENHLATGVAGPADRGLTTLGKEFLDFMKEKKMIIDLSHLNVKSFFDV
mgnify:CR=1 FL=1